MSTIKGIIIAAGYGTRFLPGTKTVPKEMFPLIDTPAIDFIIDDNGHFIFNEIENLNFCLSGKSNMEL